MLSVLGERGGNNEMLGDEGCLYYPLCGDICLPVSYCSGSCDKHLLRSNLRKKGLFCPAV